MEVEKMKVNETITVKGFKGIWIYKGDHVFSQSDNQEIYTVVAGDYPAVNSLPQLFVNEDKKFMYADAEEINS